MRGPINPPVSVSDANHEDALRDSEARLRAIMDSAIDAIITADEFGIIASVNPAVTRLFGYESGEVIGQSITLLMPAAFRQELGQDFTNYRHAGENKIIGIGREVTGRRKDGTEFPIDLAISESTVRNRPLFTGIVRDISDRRQSDELQAKLAAIVESSDDGIIGKGLDGIISTWNGGAERIFGYSTAETVGRHISLLIPPDRLHEETEIQAKLARGERIDHFETVRVTKSGQLVNISLTVSPIKNSAGKIVGASKIVRDITEKKNIEQSLLRQSEELARSNTELERFAYVASHDLQEPLRTVKSFAQLLATEIGTNISQTSAEYLRYISDGAQRMQTLIADLLAYSRVNSHGSVRVRVNCAELLQSVLINLRGTVQETHAEVTADSLPTVMGDATQLGQLFQNLISNAIKFQSKRAPRIHVSARKATDEWVFSIADNGIGIEKRYFDRIFLIFQRLHTVEEYSGTGIGLAICKKIVERHGGRIWVDSVPGEGSVFYFSISEKGTA
jgi:PAS domain S-box-containing protein